MAADKVRSDVHKIVAQQFGIGDQDISDSMGPGTLLNWDSIGHVRLVQKLEKHFGISFTVFEAMSFDTIKDICAVIEQSFSGEK